MRLPGVGRVVVTSEREKNEREAVVDGAMEKG